jgi:uncharacterized membrane protein YjgN (DUF898 family)
MQNQKPLEFEGTAGQFFVTFIIVAVLNIIPIAGAILAINYFTKWVAEHSKVNGQSVTFNASFMDTFVFVLINMLLVLITLGIYMFWYIPKMYRFIADHIVYTGAPSMASPQVPAQQPMPPTNPQPPVSSTPFAPVQ